MLEQDTETTESLREILDFRDNYDVVLACAFEPVENGDTKFELYDQIGKLVKSIGKIPYLPHKEIDLDWPCEKVYSIPNSIVIPTSDVVLSYLGLPSTAAGIMTASAIKNNIPIIWLYEQESDFECLKVRIDNITMERGMVDRGIIDTRKHAKDVEFDAINIGNGNLKDLEDCLNRFYQSS